MATRDGRFFLFRTMGTAAKWLRVSWHVSAFLPLRVPTGEFVRLFWTHKLLSRRDAGAAAQLGFGHHMFRNNFWPEES
jgi:hypothetical protein